MNVIQFYVLSRRSVDPAGQCTCPSTKQKYILYALCECFAVAKPTFNLEKIT